VGTGSDELPSFPWDPRVHFFCRLSQLMMIQVVPKSHILHFGSVLRGFIGACPTERDMLSIFIIMIEYRDDWASVTST